jgi:hypothetical protein
MGTILIRPAKLAETPDELLAQLGFMKFRKIDDARYPGSGDTWVGQAGDCIVMESHLAGAFFPDFITEGEYAGKCRVFVDAVLRLFSDATVVALTDNSVVGAWGFAVYENGRLVRRQCGCDGVVIRDEGERLPAEQTFLAQFECIEDEGKVAYINPRDPNELFHDASLGH